MVTDYGKQVEWGRYKVSTDGKTLNATEGGMDEKGAKYTIGWRYSSGNNNSGWHARGAARAC